MITFELSSEEALFAKTARDFAERRLRPAARAAESARRVPDAIAAEYLALGFGAVEIPEDYGGLGRGLAGRAVVEIALAEHGDAAMAAGMPSLGSGAAAVLLLGSEAQKIALLPHWIERGAHAAIAWSEEKPKLGTFATRAREREDGSFVLTGRKVEVLLADRAVALVVFAAAERRDGRSHPAAFVVEIEEPSLGVPVEQSSPTPLRSLRSLRAPLSSSGLRIDPPGGEELGMNAAPAMAVTFEERIVPADRMLWSSDFSVAVARMFLRIGVVGAAREVGLARAALEYARRYAEERTAFGKPIAHFQGLAFLLADVATEVEVMEGMTKRAAWALDQALSGDPQQSLEAARLAAIAIAECHEGAVSVANQAVQTLGGAGFLTDHPVEKWMRDAQAHLAFAMSAGQCDLLLGRLALECAPLSMEEDAPLPGLGAVRV